MKQGGRKVILLILVMSGIFSLAGCNGNNAQVASTPEPQAVPGFIPVVSATGEVVPSRWATLSMSIPGVIEELMVAEGDSIKSGQVLLRLNGREQMRAAVDAAEFELLSAQQAYDALYENAQLALAEAQLVLAQAEIDLDDAIEEQEKKQYRRTSDNTLDGIRADYILAQDAVEDAEDVFAGVEDRGENDPIRAHALSALSNARKARDKAKYNLNYALGLPDPEEVAKANAQLEVAKAALEDAQRKYDQLKDGPDPDDVALAAARLENAESQLESAKKSLSDLELIAPFDGTVSRLYIRTNEWVISGQPILLLADLSNLRIETTDLSEIDVAQVDVGAMVEITFDALPDVFMDGKVIKIAPKADEGSGVNYTVEIEIETIPEKLRWGMTAFVDIRTEE